MNKNELAQRLARRSHQSKGNAADQVDALIYKLIRSTKGADARRHAEKQSREALGDELNTAAVLRAALEGRVPKQPIPARTRRDGNVPGLSKAPVKES